MEECEGLCAAHSRAAEVEVFTANEFPQGPSSYSSSGRENYMVQRRLSQKEGGI